MCIAKGIVMTDGLNRKMHYISVSTILNSYEKNVGIPIIMNMGHDRSKPIGYSSLEGVYFEPGKAYLINSSYLIENKKEQDELVKFFETMDNKTFIAERKEDVKRLFTKLEGLLSEEVKVVPTGQAVAIIDKEIVRRVFPEFKELIRDGLININELEPVYQDAEDAEDDETIEKHKILIPGVYRRGEFLLFAHHYFRRSLSVANTVNDAFFIEFEKLRGKGIDVKLALDMDMIGLVGTESLELEYQYWWGPKFDDDLKSIPVGVSKYKNEYYDNLFTNVVETDFYWHLQDGINTFECEEVCDKENAIENSEKLFGCRYVHSMVNAMSNKPYHLDGSIRLYSDEQIIDRLSEGNDISKVGKETIYHKLWRIDGEIDGHVWKTLITHYFRDNYLIGEYFEGKDSKFEKIKDEKNESIVINKQEEYIPVDFKRNDGVRFFYKHVEENISIPVERDAMIVNNRMITIGKNSEKYLEADTITFFKLLENNGVRIMFSISSLIDFGDMVFNYPYVCCRDKRIVNVVLKSVTDLCMAWKNNQDNRLLSFGIILPEDVGCAKVSFAGHVDDFVKLSDKIMIPEEMSIFEWIQQIYEINTQLFGQANQKPDVFSILKGDGLWFERVFVDERIVHKYKDANGGICVKFLLNKERTEVLEQNKIIVSPSYKIKKSVCSKCSQEYRYCKCIKFISDVSENVIDADYLGMVWTNHSAYYPYGMIEVEK